MMIGSPSVRVLAASAVLVVVVAAKADAQRAYLLGMHEVMPDAIPVYAPPAQWAQAMDRALQKLDQLAPAGKELVVRGLAQTIGADGVVTVTEAELLRTICAALHCPLPPIVDQAA